MKRIELILLGALVVCACLVVHTQHHARRLFVDLERERTAGEQLAADLRRLQSDQATLAAANRVEHAAASLHMHQPEAAHTYALAPRLPGAADAPHLADSTTRGSTGAADAASGGATRLARAP